MSHAEEDRIYDAIAQEIETGNIEKGPWTRLFAECGGNENQTKALYIKRRAEKLIAAASSPQQDASGGGSQSMASAPVAAGRSRTRSAAIPSAWQEDHANDSVMQKAAPWPRYWARTLDVLLVGIPTLIFIGAVFGALSAPGTNGGLFVILCLLALGSFLIVPPALDACIVGVLGNSLGKTLLGIKVHHKDGRPLAGFSDTFKRNLHVWFRGFLFGAPLVSLIAIYQSYRDLVGAKGETKWDASLGYEVLRSPIGVLRFISFGVCFLLVLSFSSITGYFTERKIDVLVKAYEVTPKVAVAPKVAPTSQAGSVNRSIFDATMKSAEKGDAAAQHLLSFMYQEGLGVPQNDRESAAWDRKAAEQGNAEAQKNLGVMYEEGRGVPQDDREAVDWYRKAAEQGDAAAQSNLGVMYEKGRGVPQNHREAVDWYRKAAEQGDATAQSNLGVMYAKGRGVPQNDREAVDWYRKAAEQGNAQAQSNLGFMYAEGRGVPQNHREAYFWWLLSSAQGFSAAVNNRDIVEKMLTPQQRANAQANAQAWKPK